MGSGRHAQNAHNGGGFSPVLLVLALIVVVAGVGWVALRPEGPGSASADECVGREAVVVSVVPPMQVPMERAVTEIKQREACFPVELRTEDPATVEAAFFNGGRPDLWVADSPARVARLGNIGVEASTVSESLASTPVGLAGGPSADRPGSWLEAFESGRMLLSDPEVDSATALALVAPTLELATTQAEPARTEAAVVGAAQSFGVRATEGEAEPVDVQAIGTTFSQLVPVTEQDLLLKGAEVPDLNVVTPQTGAPLLTFPLVKADGGGEVDAVGAELTQWFASEPGRAALAESGLRVPGGAPLDGRGLGEVALLDETPADVFNEVLGAWRVLSVPSSVLAVFDASGSMDFSAGGGQTRMDLAVDAALTALDVFPRHARVGMWAFSIDQGGRGQDWRELAPMRRLNETTRGQDHYSFLRSRVPTLKAITQGGTGLYDTTVAAYDKAVRAYDKNFFNAVILLSDGANDDPGSLSLGEVINRLEKLRDPDRPVRIISVGVSKDADMPALKKISEATGGQAYQAVDPRDILDVFAKALMSR